MQLLLRQRVKKQRRARSRLRAKSRASSFYPAGRIKTILNEEYGWYKGDTAVKQEATTKPRFKIEFSETDSASAIKDTATQRESKGIYRIFRKKKGSGMEF